mmetsp:Transcript_7136/g.23665  ORF Transcript_7136/g.23665 Transcript_7136/m.23665 type:complete len:239 (+) Transcript_7136:134-850(+)
MGQVVTAAAHSAHRTRCPHGMPACVLARSRQTMHSGAAPAAADAGSSKRSRFGARASATTVGGGAPPPTLPRSRASASSAAATVRITACAAFASSARRSSAGGGDERASSSSSAAPARPISASIASSRAWRRPPKCALAPYSLSGAIAPFGRRMSKRQRSDRRRKLLMLVKGKKPIVPPPPAKDMSSPSRETLATISSYLPGIPSRTKSGNRRVAEEEVFARAPSALLSSFSCSSLHG